MGLAAQEHNVPIVCYLECARALYVAKYLHMYKAYGLIRVKQISMLEVNGLLLDLLES